ncbi:AAA family ATPase [Streptomyces sp. NPDC002698]|uniref:AAA family ATPase n=1 Tax=Streptomyces sp. NPDC002698 TaxID=3364660 RepID=UPI0036B004FC
MTDDDWEQWAETESEPLQAPRSSWIPQDLTAVLDGTAEPILPTVGHREDGPGLFYPRRTHWVAAESESGKTWFALLACRQEIERGNHVVYVDFEDDAAGVVKRLLTLGADPDDVAARFLYLRPETRPTELDLLALVQQLLLAEPTLAVIDGVTEAMSVFGLDPLKLDDIPKFTRWLITPLVKAGAAVVALDHVVKAADNRGRYAIGSAHKLNGLNGAMYVLEKVQGIKIGETGRTRVRISKDRPAQLRRHALPGRSGSMDWFADLVVESHDERHATVRLFPPTAPKDEDQAEAAKVQQLRAEVLEALAKAGRPLSTQEVKDRVRGRAEDKIRALAALEDEGLVDVADGPRRAKLWSSPADRLA